MAFTIWMLLGPALTIIAALIIDICLDAYRRKQLSGIKPWLACFLDAICVYPQYLGVGYWKKNSPDMKDIVEKVKKTAGLSDFGGDENEMIRRYQPLLTNGVKKSGAVLSPLGLHICASTVGKRVLQRLQLVSYLKRHPAIEKVKLQRPVFVIGFPRTGTTFLHELLGLHPSVRMHYSWEQMYPIPETDKESMEALTAERTRRYNKNKSEFTTLLAIAGDEIQSIHRVGYDESEECSTPCGMEVPFNINTIPFLCFVAKEVGDLGAGQAFHLYRKYLQVSSHPSSSFLSSDIHFCVRSFLLGKQRTDKESSPGCSNALSIFPISLTCMLSSLMPRSCGLIAILWSASPLPALSTSAL
jgi:hypothetical protein